MNLTEQLPITLYADQEHNKLRLVVLLVMPVAVGLSYWLGIRLIDFVGGILTEYAVFLSCLWALPVGLGAVYTFELWLKRRWPSGDTITLEPDRMVAHKRDGEQISLQPEPETAVTNWYFRLDGYPRVGNERRANKGWYCLACQLQQDERRIVVYAFLSPRETAVYTAESTLFNFYLMKPGLLYDRKLGGSRMAPRPMLPPDLLRKKDGRFWLAESHRWTEGLELTPQDFKLYMEYIRTTLY